MVDHYPSYCNSIIQCLYYSNPFREHVVGFPHRSPPNIPHNSPTSTASPNNGAVQSPQNAISSGGASPRKGVRSGTTALMSPPTKSEDKDSPEYKKKLALATGPILNIEPEQSSSYGMSESLFTSLKDIFEGIIGHQSRTGVVSPSKFLEILKRDNEMFRTAMHQDAHEFLNLLLNQVVESVEDYSKKPEIGRLGSCLIEDCIEVDRSANNSAASKQASEESKLNSRWVHELFEGTLTSETRCLTCENLSQRDEAFLDLSVDLEQHSSVTSCLRKFSEEEMLCERNKFHCDNCGGLQEAEKRMKIKKLPRILALHLKRFKYTEDLQRLQKLFHRVVFPYNLRLFNTTDDAEDPDRLYELYAVVVHIGGGPYHGHYVSIVKTQDRGWLLFDDEIVEPLSKGFIRNFFGGEHSLACAYILFYQETTFENSQKEQDDEACTAAQPSDLEEANGLSPTTMGSASPDVGFQPIRTDISPVENGIDERLASAGQVMSPQAVTSTTSSPGKKVDGMPVPNSPLFSWRRDFSKDDKMAKKEEKARRAAEREQEKLARREKKESVIKEQEKTKQQEMDVKTTTEASKATKTEEDSRLELSQNGHLEEKAEEPPTKNGSLSRFKHGSKSLKSMPKFWTSGKEKNGTEADQAQNQALPVEDFHDFRKYENGTGPIIEKPEKAKSHRFGIGKKKSTIFSGRID